MQYNINKIRTEVQKKVDKLYHLNNESKILFTEQEIKNLLQLIQKEEYKNAIQ